MIEHIAGKRNVVADALSRLLMLSHVWDSGISDDDPNSLWRIKQLLFPPFRPDDPPTLTLNGVFDDFDVSAKEAQAPPPKPMNIKEIFDSVHNSTAGHWGAVETWRRMNKFAPGHGLSQKDVAKLVLLCANCEKNRRERGQTSPNCSKPQAPALKECYRH